MADDRFWFDAIELEKFFVKEDADIDIQGLSLCQFPVVELGAKTQSLELS